VEAGYIRLGYGEVALAAALILINGALSLALGLGLERRLLVASARTVVQLLLIGYLLKFIFGLRHPLWVLLLGLVMAALAGQAAVGRVSGRFRGIHLGSTLSVLVSSFVVTGLAVAFIVRPRPWYEPQYVIPLLGMVLGNTLNGISLGLDRFLEGLVRRRDQVEGLLALGATRWEACRDVMRDAVRTGMVPTLNAMAVVGLVSLPGMMTGQILAGADPADAVRYQIVIMFMIAAATALGTLGAVAYAYRSLLDGYHRLRLDRLQTPPHLH